MSLSADRDVRFGRKSKPRTSFFDELSGSVAVSSLLGMLFFEQTDGDADMAREVAIYMLADKVTELEEAQKQKPKEGKSVAEKFRRSRMVVALVSVIRLMMVSFLLLVLMVCVSVLRIRLIKQFFAPASSWLDVVWFKVFPL